ncbi:MAG: hypothetical protein A2469_00295 [Candidatus Magasanikbacteria bacterium RIFOXYC2_FULL_40_16]|uniref:Transcobalamin-like C-terminal domain-containing protein n=3 Tax=Candidatus Magasanikiibacteriota TaxID=1752731 RepID=A0A1F6NHX7_9BACT|nr:MAG: hypothetical protein A2224_00300 [Candidatus Magasanikbacteria bacterium RIFOXYA2_FULL_40_20]OGH83353.1 MAG: hypothetical protein A2373_00040 [Candidatus Magasanikbacteria bacterium RIFOXYB1_FULL_40_15]OGH86823.1 MAG: hypothetical protein A2301_02855 [Candidatus Magasanikbacteria bacterium RIFOXYB2_FULL_40_13]OGH87357.1 MAG: hypothetical protein A2206_02805 [Candidatus Magasanikbacteria bacterium RIFOXYA1_FULL_40_8]OGH90427.1 MAG: hypothetical protein A2469_00295 [Candidatus Magasanikba
MKKIFALFLIIIATATSGCALTKNTVKQNNPNKIIEQAQENKASIIVNGQNYSAEFPAGATGYDFLVLLSKQTDFKFNGIDYGGDLGFFVNEVNEIQNTNEKYWVYYINGEEAQTGISTYLIKPNDTIEWKYEESIY